jgi:hypothetical protein
MRAPPALLLPPFLFFMSGLLSFVRACAPREA